jgi:hypothetical protein
MKLFPRRQIREAMAHAGAGGQALHVMGGSFAYLRPDTPSCFKGRSEIAHLFDQNRDRLIKTAKRFGVRVIKVERDGGEGQHIDLCGKPLERAQNLAKQIEWESTHGLLDDVI